MRPDAVGSASSHVYATSCLGHRVSDEFTVPVCRVHHRELHRRGDEGAWWGKVHIDPLPVALRLWQHTRLNGDDPSEGITPSQTAQKLDIAYFRKCGCGHRRNPFVPDTIGEFSAEQAAEA